MIKSAALAATFFSGAFLEAHLHCADTFVTSARPETADETVTSGTANLFPTRVRSKNQHRTNVARQFYGLVSNFDTGLPEITVSVGASIRH